MSKTFVDAINAAQSIIKNENSRQQALAKIEEAERELASIKAELMGRSYSANSFGSQSGNYQYDPMPE